MSEIRIFDADDEEPNCNRCDNMLESDEFCSNCYKCGWSGYCRTEIIKE